MKNLFCLTLTFFLLCMYVDAQNKDLLDVEKDSIDSIFDEPKTPAQTPSQSPSQTPAQTTPTTQTPARSSPVLADVNRRGLTFSASYFFKLAANPGWGYNKEYNEEGVVIDYIGMYPWDLTGDENEHFSWAFGVEAGATMSIIAQISNSFRVLTIFKYGIPNFVFTIEDFYFDYNFLDYVFLRAGKLEQSWGISPNFAFTDLLSRIATQRTNPNKPDNYDKDAVSTNGPSYLMKTDIPIGIGGIQLIALTRADLAGGIIPTRDYVGFGGKFNLALKWAEFNLAHFAQSFMAARTSLSIKTNIFNTDIYNEWLINNNNHTDDSVGFAVNIGLTKSFFNEKLEINTEYFYNGEEKTEYYSPETDLREEEILPFLEGHNFAFNVLYKFGGKMNPRVFTGLLYGDDSYSITFGVRVKPLPNIDIYLAVPMGFGEGYYYQSITNRKNEHRPFSVLLLVNFNGGVSLSRYY